VSERSEWSADAVPDETLPAEVSTRFQNLMRKAMYTSFYKYGAVAEGYPDRVNALDSLKLRLKKYAQTGNVEYLVDVANFAMIEFMHPAHPKAHYKATDASGSPGRVMANEEIYDRPTQLKNTDLEPAQ
jgi:predicted MPP superfamily phosphohydrolase